MKGKIIVINFADSNFERNRKFNSLTAKYIGKADEVIEYSPDSIDEDFKAQNAKIFAYKRGAGLWLWKPYIIKKALEEIKEGDFLFYVDAGAFFVKKIQWLIDTMNRDVVDIMLIESSLLDSQFTKKEAFVLMNYDDYTNNQLSGNCILLRKTKTSIDFVNEWLSYMCNEEILSPDCFHQEIEEFPDFIAHREDQSILSILCRKKGLKPYRDPSQYGDRPWEYSSKEKVVRIRQYENSLYPKIIVSNRRAAPIPYLVKECIKTLLYKLRLMTLDKYMEKYNIPQRNIIVENRE